MAVSPVSATTPDALASAVIDHLQMECVAIGHVAPHGRVHVTDRTVLSHMGRRSLFNRGCISDLGQPDVVIGEAEAFFGDLPHTLWLPAETVTEDAEQVLKQRGYLPLPPVLGMATTELDTGLAHSFPGHHADLLTEVTDAPRVAAVTASGYGIGIDDRLLMEDVARAMLRHAKPWDHGALYGVDIDGSLVAAGALLIEGGAAGISGLASLPGHRRDHNATVIVARALKDAAAQGARASVSISSPESLTPLEHLGFSEVIRFRVFRAAGQ